jgi:hypothetical protein
MFTQARRRPVSHRGRALEAPREAVVAVGAHVGMTHWYEPLAAIEVFVVQDIRVSKYGTSRHSGCL